MITLFTAVYNRAHMIGKLYRSIANQTLKDLEWIIVDDGSTDNIDDVVDMFIKDGLIEIKYVKQVHGGKHRAINKAEDLSSGEAIVFVDSDDILLPNAVERLTEYYMGIKKDDDIIAAAGLMCDSKGRISGRNHNPDNMVVLWSEKNRFGIDGEYVYIFKRGVWKKHFIPEYEGELFASEAIAMFDMSLEGKKICYHGDVLYQYEYQNNGLSLNIEKLYRNNPQGYAMLCYKMACWENDFNRYMQLCTEFYEICYDCLNRQTAADDILHIKEDEKKNIRSSIEKCLNSIQEINGIIGIYGFGYYGHRMKRYLEILDRPYVLIDKNARNMHGGSQKIYSLEDKPFVDTVILCVKDAEKSENIVTSVQRALPNTEIKYLQEFI